MLDYTVAATFLGVAAWFAGRHRRAAALADTGRRPGPAMVAAFNRGRVAERWREDAPSRTVELETAESLPILGDAGRLEQILDNLIAAKKAAGYFAPAGAPSTAQLRRTTGRRLNT